MRQGGASVRSDARNAIFDAVVRLVRWTLQTGGTDSLSRRILAEARRLAPAGEGIGESLAVPVARAICERLLEQMRRPHSRSSQTLDTVCN
jgi:hypothetical protein